MKSIGIWVLVLYFGICSQANGQGGIIATVAGGGNSGLGDGGRATLASMYPESVAVDISGNLIIADTGNNRIRKVSASGIITTVAGNGSSGFSGDGRPATSASLSQPDGVAVDASGNLFIADTGNNRIRKVSASGVITTVAGTSGFGGYTGDGGPATSSPLNAPTCVAVDPSGNLFIADFGNQRIRKVSASGIITTVAGNGKFGFSGDGGPASSASMAEPSGVAVDALENLFIADSYNSRIRKVSSSGIITTVAGNGKSSFAGDGGPAASASLSYPTTVALDVSGNLLIADSYNSRIRKVSSSGIIMTVAGNGSGGLSGDGGPATSAALGYPEGVAVDASGNFFIAASRRVREVLAESGIPPVVFSANNSADYSTTIAQGSLFVVFGYSLGPAALAQTSTFPLPNLLSGTSVTVTSGSTTLNCPLIYTSNGQVAAILPSNTPVGPAEVTVTYNGAETAPYAISTSQVTVVRSSVGIFTATGSGLGTGIFTALDGSVKTFANSAQPGDILNIWATGLGPIAGPDNLLPTSFPTFPNVQVWVGGQAAQIAYAGRSGCCAAVDQIAFTVPAVANGCNVPVTVVVGGNSSNPVTLPVSGSGGACSDSGPTLPTSFLTKADAGQPVSVAAIGVGPRAIGSSTAGAQGLADHLSAALHTRVSEADAARLMRAYKAKNPRAIRVALAKYARQWKALDAQSKARLAAQLGQTQVGASAAFGRYGSEGLAATIAAAQLPTAGACIVLPHAFTSGLGSVSAGLDAGSSLSVTGAAGSLTMNETFDRIGQYHASFASSFTGPNITLGSYTISGSGGKDVGAFEATITVESHLAISNKSSLATVDRTQPLTIAWTGGVAGKYVLIGGYTPNASSSGETLPNAYFACAEDAGKGTFIIPSYILSSMNATASGQGVLAISPHPLSKQISIPGIDLAYFVDGSSDSVNVTFK